MASADKGEPVQFSASLAEAVDKCAQVSRSIRRGRVPGEAIAEFDAISELPSGVAQFQPFAIMLKRPLNSPATGT